MSRILLTWSRFVVVCSLGSKNYKTPCRLFEERNTISRTHRFAIQREMFFTIPYSFKLLTLSGQNVYLYPNHNRETRNPIITQTFSNCLKYYMTFLSRLLKVLNVLLNALVNKVTFSKRKRIPNVWACKDLYIYIYIYIYTHTCLSKYK